MKLCSLFTYHFSLQPLAGRPNEEGIATSVARCQPETMRIVRNLDLMKKESIREVKGERIKVKGNKIEMFEGF
jgi:hypothetical protein